MRVNFHVNAGKKISRWVFISAFGTVVSAVLSLPLVAATETAIFAGGCFWCMEKPFDELDGVISTTSGYSGGHVKKPSYKQVSSGRTGHTEVVQVVFDPDKISYAQLLDVFWRNIDPLDARGQFCDKGSQYRSGIFFLTEKQQRAALASRDALVASARFKQPLVTEISAAGEFYQAEDYHQNYYQRNPVRYKYYRYRCGRDQRLKELWGEQSG